MLVTSTYSPNKDTHTRRSDVTNEVVGTGYTAGGTASTVTVAAVDTTNDRVVITFGAVSWTTATITARGAVYYKSRGGASSADEIIAYDDFGSDIVSTVGTFSLAASTVTKQN
jgi:cytoskeletal protein RodZ